MSDIFEEYHPLTGKTFCVLDAEGNLDGTYAPDFSDDQLRDFYRAIVLARVADQKALNLQRQGRMGTYAPVLGQEGIQIGVAAAMGAGDWLFPSYRELAATLMRGLPLSRTYLYWMGNEEGSRIPDGVNVFSFSVPVGTHMLHSVGAAWAAKLKGEKIAVVSFFGDGATSEGDFHEALNFAGVLKTANVFVCQNNQYAISVPLKRQTGAATIAQKAIAYGFDGIRVDGNDVFASYVAARTALDKARNGGGPALIEAVTFRLGAHTTADDPSRYRTDEEVERWRKLEPLVRLESYMRTRGLLGDALVDKVKEESEAEVERAVEEAEGTAAPAPEDIFKYMFAEMTPALREQLVLLEQSLPAMQEE